MRPYYVDFEQTETRRAKAIAMARPIAWHRQPPAPRRKGASEIWNTVLALFRTWRGRVRTRRELAALDARMRRDIGASPSDVAYEIAKPFWRA
jgi:uncharacterized protein YjiS (DUF1127 family)